MIAEHVCQWIEKFRPRVRQYLYYQDVLGETLEKVGSLEGREKIDLEMKIVGDFFVSEFYNADFDPWPDLETRIDTIDDLKKRIENDIDRKRFENSIDFIFREEKAVPEEPKPAFDSQQNAFFAMMADAYGTNDFYNEVERSKTKVTEILSEPLPEDGTTGQDSGSLAEDLLDEEGANSLKDQLADILDGHLDSF